jgi:TolB-like protein/DNA-binding winged helix-turn-helix (wHTH) protein/Tfp pilus assembly protein PilF
MQKLSHQTHSFGEFTLDLTRGCLSRGEEEIKLRPKSFEALKYLVENNGRLISKDELIHAVWVDTAVTDDSLVKCLKDIRHALSDEAQQIIKTVPRRGYIFDKEVTDNAATAQLSTHTEETAGVQVIIEERTNGHGDPETRGRGDAIAPLPAQSKFAYLIAAIKQHQLSALLGVLTLAVAAAAIVYFTRPGEVIDSVAVMPFVNVSGDAATEYLSDGISYSIINNLSELPSFKKVIALSSVLSYKGKQIDPQAVGRDYNVRAVLTGRVIQHGDDLSISAELVDVRDNRHIWGQQYNRKLADITGLPREIAQAMSEKLRLPLSGAERKQLTKHYSESSEAYEAYWKGLYHNIKKTPEELQESIRYFQRAIDIDPNFALPYAGLANSYNALGNRGGLSPMEAYPKASAAATKALELDDTIAEAHHAQGVIKRENWDFAGAEKEYKRAIELNPSYIEAHHAYAHLLLAIGRPDEALSESLRLLEIYPLDLTMNAHLGWQYLSTRQYDQAIEKCRGTLEVGDNYFAHYYLGQAYEQKGRYDEGIAEFKKAIAMSKASTEATAALGHAYAISGRTGEAHRVLEELQESSKKHYVSLGYQALIYAGLGEKDKAFEWLQKAADERAGWLIFINVDPRYDSLRSDPRFQALQRRVGLAQ